MKIAIHAHGDWRDAEVASNTMAALIAAKLIWTHGESTAEVYDEKDDPRTIYYAEDFPLSIGLTYLAIGE